MNKIQGQALLTKIAVMKRAYRKKPSLGLCPNPETAWTAFPMANVQPLEGLFRFCHRICKAFLDKLPPQSRTKVQANIDVTAADTFLIAATESQKKNNTSQEHSHHIRKELLVATAKYLEPLGLTPTSHPPSCPGGEDAWISFADAPAVAEQPVPKAAESTSTKGFGRSAGIRRGHWSTAHVAGAISC